MRSTLRAVKAIRRFTVRTVLPEQLQPLHELALNLRWSWHPETRELFRSVEPGVWEAVGEDPVRLLGEVPAARLAALAADRRFLRRLGDLTDDLHDYLSGPRWYQSALPAGEGPAAIAYFSPEYGIAAALPQYSGGLGILAGDHLKAASDLGVPLIGVGLFYRHGYFRQSLARDGWQQERYPVLDPDELAVTLLREADGTACRVELALPGGRTLAAQIWKAQVGRVPLLLLDSDLEANATTERDVTDRLYGGGSEHRLLQEMLLGIGGVRAVRAFCRLTGHPEPEVFHTNEGHAGFLGIERIRELVASASADFSSALEAVRAGTLFTTHTPVPAGIDRFDRELVARHFSGDAALRGVPVDQVLGLGLENWPGGDPKLFNMAAMGLRLAQRANGVSTLHGEVSRTMFGALWPGFDTGEVPITSITNGVHAPTWIDPAVVRLGAAEIGADRAESAMSVGGAERWSGVEQIGDGEIWGAARAAGPAGGGGPAPAARLLAPARGRRRRARLDRRGARPGRADHRLRPPGALLQAAHPDAAGPGAAARAVAAPHPPGADRGGRQGPPGGRRRQAADPAAGGLRRRSGGAPPDRLPAGLRHGDGQAPLPRLRRLAEQSAAPAGGLRHLGDEGRAQRLPQPVGAGRLVGGVVRRPQRLGDPDGRRPRLRRGPARRHRGGRALRPDRASGRGRLLRPGADGLPHRWIAMVRHTLVTLGPKVLAGRMVREYVERLYAPAALAQRGLTGEGARLLALWKAKVRAAWPAVRVEHVDASAAAEAEAAELGSALALRVQVALGGLAPEDVEVQAVSGTVDESDRIREAETQTLKPVGGPDLNGCQRYEGTLELSRTGPFGYTVRVLPSHPLLASPAELGLVALPPESAGMDAGVLR